MQQQKKRTITIIKTKTITTTTVNMTELKQPTDPNNPIVFLDIQIGLECGKLWFFLDFTSLCEDSE